MFRGENIICLSSMTWDSVWTRRQRFMNMLAEQGNKVLFVEPPISIVTLLRFPEGSFNPTLKPKIKKIKENLNVLTPPLLLPFQAISRLINRMNQLILGNLVSSCQRRLSFCQPILWMYSPAYADILGKVRARMLVYDCVDEFSEYPGFNKHLILNLERKLVMEADIVFVTAKGLLSKRRRLSPNTFYLPNGVDVQHFSQAQNRDLKIPSEISKLLRPILGFVGGIYEWVDLDLIEYLAKQKHQYSIVILGPVGKRVNVSNLSMKYRNVYFLGRKKLKDLPAYIKGFDVCLIPFKVNKLTSTVNPLKAYEYLAAGKPVVSVTMPEISHLERLIYFAESYEHFAMQVQIAIAEDCEEKVRQRIEEMKNYSWERLLSIACRQIQQVEANLKRNYSLICSNSRA